MTKNEILTILLTLDEYNQNHLLRLIQAWQIGNKTHSDYLIYSLNNTKKLLEFIKRGYSYGYIASVDKFFTLNEKEKIIETAPYIRGLIDFNLIAKDIKENKTENFYFNDVFHWFKFLRNK